MKGRKTATIPGIIMAAVAIEDDDKFGYEVKIYLKRHGDIRGRKDKILKDIQNLIQGRDDFEFGNAVRELLCKRELIVLRDGKYETSKS